MAHIVTNETSLLERQTRLQRENKLLNRILLTEWLLASVLALAGLLLYYLKGSTALLVVGGLAIFLALGHFVKARENRSDIEAIERGRAGEQSVTQLLASRLDNHTYIFNDLFLQCGALKAQYDHIVIGPNGLFIIETKNWPGHLSGNEQDAEWIISSGAQSRRQKMKNPVRQLRRQRNLMLKKLAALNVDWPDLTAFLVFAGRTTWNIENQRERIFPTEPGVEFVRRYRGLRSYSDPEIETVMRMLRTGAA